MCDCWRFVAITRFSEPRVFEVFIIHFTEDRQKAIDVAELACHWAGRWWAVDVQRRASEHRDWRAGRSAAEAVLERDERQTIQRDRLPATGSATDPVHRSLIRLTNYVYVIIAPPYLATYCTTTSSTAGRSHLRSALIPTPVFMGKAAEYIKLCCPFSAFIEQIFDEITVIDQDDSRIKLNWCGGASHEH